MDHVGERWRYHIHSDCRGLHRVKSASQFCSRVPISYCKAEMGEKIGLGVLLFSGPFGKFFFRDSLKTRRRVVSNHGQQTAFGAGGEVALALSFFCTLTFYSFDVI